MQPSIQMFRGGTSKIHCQEGKREGGGCCVAEQGWLLPPSLPEHPPCFNTAPGEVKSGIAPLDRAEDDPIAGAEDDLQSQDTATACTSVGILAPGENQRLAFS